MKRRIEARRPEAGSPRWRRRWWAVIAAVTVAGASVPISGGLLAGSAGAAIVPTPSPTLTTPPAGRGFPHMAVAPYADFAQRGYVEDEVFIEGTARSYVADAPLAGIIDGRWNASPTGPTAAYQTRLLIRRPENPNKFNGTVIVEWLNVSAGFDLDAMAVGLDEMIDEGFAYVGVSAQATGVRQMKGLAGFASDPVRYASLVHPGDSYSYDIFSQAAQAIRNPSAGPAPLGNLTGDITALIASGVSQSGSRLLTYINAVHPTVGLYDGFLPSLTNNGAALTQSPLPAVSVPGGRVASKIRTDSDEPVLFLNSDTEFNSAGGIHLQPDSPTFRLWEITGMQHAGTHLYFDPVLLGQYGASLGLSPKPPNEGALPHSGPLSINFMHQKPAYQAAIHALWQWMETGEAPMSAPRANLTIPGDPTQPVVINRDAATGIALGGIRLPDVAVPIQTLVGFRPAAAIPPGCRCNFLHGASDPWNGDTDPYDGTTLDISPTPEPSLSALYGTEEKYVKAVKEAADDLVDDGFLLHKDALEIIKKAKTVDIP